jgi:hypothetical protein
MALSGSCWVFVVTTVLGLGTRILMPAWMVLFGPSAELTRFRIGQQDGTIAYSDQQGRQAIIAYRVADVLGPSRVELGDEVDRFAGLKVLSNSSQVSFNVKLMKRTKTTLAANVQHKYIFDTDQKPFKVPNSP